MFLISLRNLQESIVFTIFGDIICDQNRQKFMENDKKFICLSCLKADRQATDSGLAMNKLILFLFT